MLVVVFDVESVGLHGEGFAVGAVAVDTETGDVLEELEEACLTGLDEEGDQESVRWVNVNVQHTQVARDRVRNLFWRFWRKWANQGAHLLADCAWPVKANFLSRCVKMCRAERSWQGPYPLLDLSSILWAQGMDPTAMYDRLPNELPAHNPLNDARQSARLLVAACRRQVRETAE